MQFKKLLVMAPLVVSVLAAPAPAPVPVNITDISDLSLFQIDTFEASAPAVDAGAVIEERQFEAIATTIVMQIVKDILTPLVQEAIRQAGILIKDVSNWTAAREAFTKATVLAMWQANPDPARYPAVVCYNMDYRLADPVRIAGATKVELRTGLLHTDYDCMYLEAPNTFFGLGDGGFINFASISDKSRCSFDSNTRQVRCTR